MRKYLLLLFLSVIALTSYAQNSNYKEGLAAFESKEYSKAYNLLKPFADSGDAMAEFIIGYCYMSPELGMKNNLLAERYLTSSAEKLEPKAMGLLSIYHLQQTEKDKKRKIQALVWAEIAGAYDPAFNATTARILIRNYLDKNELAQVEEILKYKKAKFDKIDLDVFHKLNERAIPKAHTPDKVNIPKNKFNLMTDPYFDWVYRWKLEKFECDTMYYTESVESDVIDSAIYVIKKTSSFEPDLLHQPDGTKDLVITKSEQALILAELIKLKQQIWPVRMFPYSKRLRADEVKSTLAITEKLPLEKEKNMCSIIYTFSKPIFIRNGTVALFLDQQYYRGGDSQLNFSFYKLDKLKRWEKLAVVYESY